MRLWIVDCGSWIADAVPAPDVLVNGAWVTGFVVSVIGAVFAGMKIRSTINAQVGPQPFEVELRKSYVSREDCLACKNDMRSDVRDMRVMYDKLVTLINDRDEKTAQQIRQLGEVLHGRITQAAEDAAERRRAIHDKLGIHADLLSRIDTRTDVSRAIGKLGGAILAMAKEKSN